jgi:hypothetical protein
LQLVSNAPALTFINAISFTHYATVGMATANNNFITGAVLGDLVLGAYNTNNIWFINNNTNTTRMRLDSDGGGTFSGFVSASGPKSQIRVNGNSVGCGISLTNTIVGANRRNWGIFTEENVEGDFVIKRSTTSGGTPNTNVLSLSRDGDATFSSSVTTSGNVTLNSSSLLRLGNSDNASTMQIWNSQSGAANNFLIYDNAASAYRFVIGNTGNVAIGTGSPVDRLTIARNAADNTGGLTLYNENNQGYGSAINFRVNYAGVYNTSRIHGDWDTGNTGALHFFTANTSQTLVERMTITGGGQVTISSSLANNFILSVTNSSSTSGEGIISNLNSSSSTLTYFAGYSTSDSAYKFLARTNGDVRNATGVYGTISSDRRLKENIVSATPKLDDIMKLNVVNFNLIGNQEKQIGFIAQEMQEVFPSLVDQTDTRQYDEDGNVISGLEDAFGVKVGMEFAILVKAIQELKLEIDELKEKIK